MGARIEQMGTPLPDYYSDFEKSEGGILMPKQKDIIQTSKYSPEVEEEMKHITDYQLLMILGLYKGDEGKGTDAYRAVLAYIERYGIENVLLISSVGGDNAGHVVVFPDGTSFTGSNLPGAAATGVDTFLGQGKFINILGLGDEIQQLRSNENAGKLGNIFIAEDAHCTFPSIHGKLDGVIENIKSQNKNPKGGTTLKGIGPANATKALRTGITINELFNYEGEELKHKIDILIGPFESVLGDKEDIYREVFQYKATLVEMEKADVIQIVSNDYGREQHMAGKACVLEGSQSMNLGSQIGLSGENSSIYRQNTAGDTTFLGNLSPLGIVPVPGNLGILGVSKVLQSTVGTHDALGRISHVHPSLIYREIKFALETGEVGSVTGRPRQIGYFDLTIIVEFIRTHGPYVAGLSFRKLDLVNKFLEIMKLQNLPIITSYDDNGKPVLERIEPTIQNIMSIILRELDKVSLDQNFNKPIVAGLGAKPDQSTVIFPDDIRSA